MNQKKDRIQFICVLSVTGLLLALVTGCRATAARGASANEATPTPVPTPIVPEKPTYMVQVGTVIETLEFTGRASPVQEQELFFETNGNVSDVYVARGDWVTAGDLLAELEISDLQKQLTQKTINLETARLRLEEAQIQATEAITTTLMKLDEAKRNLQQTKISSANDLAAARAAVASAETNLANAKLNLTIVQNSDVVVKNVRDREYEAAWWEAFYGECLKKYEAGQIDKDRLDLEYNNLLAAKERLEAARAQASLALSQAEAQVSQAEESLRQAKVKLAELQSQSAVANAEAALRQAELDYAQAVAAADPDSYNLRLLTLEVEQVQLDIQDLENQIAKARLVAPFDGQVLSLNIEAGDAVQAYSTVGVLADPTKLEITAELSSDELSQMALNQKAEITLRNRPGETFSGVVRQLPYPYGGTTVDTGDDTAVHVSVESEVDMGLGELATVRIILQEKENVLWLPPAAIRTYQGRYFVVVQNPDGSQRRVDVLLGITTDEQVEITAGLEAGQIVIGE
ncbi:MAG: HlyD family efflux transporter periplasmic adaptor subunit [Anaerolineae bacterium]